MASNKNNTDFEKTSFLQGGNSPFIKELYLKYLNDPKSIPSSWLEIFNGLNEDQEIIKKEILGPSWAPKKKNYPIKNILDSDLSKEKQNFINKEATLDKSEEKKKEQYLGGALSIARNLSVFSKKISIISMLGENKNYLNDIKKQLPKT